MTGDRKTSWKILACGIAMLCSNTCAAGSEPSEPNQASGTSGAPSPAGADWGLPDFMTKWKLPETVQIHGFASQSYLRTTGNEFFGHSTNMGSLDFTEMGINGSWRPLSNLQTSMQVVYRRAGQTDNSSVRIDFGFLDYSFVSESESLAGVRLGRVVNPYGFYNDTRDMPFTRPSILLPQSIYFDINRQFAFSGDGAQLYGERHSNIGDFFLQVNGFYSRTNDPDIKFGIADDLPGHMESSPSFAARLMYEWDAGRVRLGVTGAEINAKYEPAGGVVNLEPGTLSVSPILFSAQYNAELWSLTGEYAVRETTLNGFGPLLPDMDFTGESYYIQGTYRITQNLEGLLRYDVLYADRSDKNGKNFEAATGLPAYGRFAKDITAGLRWDITSWLMLRAEYHRINGTAWTSDLENRGETTQHWDMFGVSASVRF